MAFKRQAKRTKILGKAQVLRDLGPGDEFQFADAGYGNYRIKRMAQGTVLAAQLYRKKGQLLEQEPEPFVDSISVIPIEVPE